jgi:hypothetical protein
MRLTHLAPEGWSLLDEEQQVLRHVAGRLTAWAPRLAGGEGVWALPLTGRIYDRGALARHDLRAGLGRLFSLSAAAGASPELELAAVVGNSLEGRRNPFRSICGYTAAQRLSDRRRLGPVLITRDEVGDTLPASLADAEAQSVAERLLRLHHDTTLRTGDVVLLGPLGPAEPLRTRLMTIGANAPRVVVAAEEEGGAGHLTPTDRMSSPREQR